LPAGTTQDGYFLATDGPGRAQSPSMGGAFQVGNRLRLVFTLAGPYGGKQRENVRYQQGG
jgi:hypothetical protein